MAYFIFLKYLRSLEEFRKNPHIKISPKSPCANFQSLGIFKNQILFGKEFFFPSLSAHPPFRPSRGPLIFLLSNRPLLLSPLGLGLSAGPSRPLGPADRAPVPPCRIAANHTGRRFQPHRLCPLCAWLAGGPHLSSLTSGSTELGRAATASRRSPRRPAPHFGCRPSCYSPHHHPPSPLIPLLTSHPSSMALKPLTPPLLPPATPLRRSPAPVHHAWTRSTTLSIEK
jgi:hypothetical protein